MASSNALCKEEKGMVGLFFVEFRSLEYVVISLLVFFGKFAGEIGFSYFSIHECKPSTHEMLLARVKYHSMTLQNAFFRKLMTISRNLKYL